MLTIYHCCLLLNNLFFINSQKFRSELKKNREKVLGASEGSSKTKRKEVYMCFDVLQAILQHKDFSSDISLNYLLCAVSVWLPLMVNKS